MKLYFMRHGKASPFANTDEQRPLTPEGADHIRLLGQFLHDLGVAPERIYSSPRLRALQTANLIGDALGLAPVINNACNFHFDVDKMLPLLQGLSEDAEVMFVGHNPSMSEIVGAVAGAQVDLSTGGVAYVTRFSPERPADGTLKWLLTRKLLTALMNE